MDIYDSKTGPKIIGIGEAVVLEVRKTPSQAAHQIRISHPDLGDTGFITYVPPSGMYSVPRIGDICYVFCNENFHQYPIAWGHRISPALAKELLGDRIDNITIIYSSGPNNNTVTHKIELDDGANSGVRITTGSGSSVELKDQGNITVKHKDGGTATISGDTISFVAGGSTLEISATGVSVKAASGSTLDIGATILGKAADQKSTFDDVGVATHSHEGNLAYPTSPPIKGT